MTTMQSAQPARQAGLTVTAAQLGIGLYIATLVLELPGVLIRYALVSAFFWIVGKMTLLIAALAPLASLFQPQPLTPRGEAATPPVTGILSLIIALLVNFSSVALPLATIIAWGPLVSSVASFVLPGGFFFKRFGIGAREPSLRERNAVRAAIEQLEANAPPGMNIQMVRDFFILDTSDIQQEATVIGSTLYLSRGLVRSQDDLAALLAHALGHSNSLDGKLTLALRRFVLFPVYLISRALNQIAPGVLKIGAEAGAAGGCLAGALVYLFSGLLALSGGGFGTFILAPLWAWFWRHREYAADQYAATLGQGNSLIAHLEKFQGSDMAVPYLRSEVPSSELRIDRLMNPGLYQDTDRFDLRPYLITVVVFLGIVCGLPSLISGITYAFNSPLGDWQLVKFSRVANQAPIASVDEDQQFILSVQGNNHFVATYFFGVGPNAYVNQQSGTFERTGTTELLFTATEGNGSLPYGLNGRWTIERNGDHLILRSDYEAYDFVRMDSREGQAIQQTMTAKTAEQTFLQAFSGSWISPQSEQFQFFPNDTRRGQVTISSPSQARSGIYILDPGERTITIQWNNGGARITYSVTLDPDETHLTLAEASNPQNTIILTRQ